MATKPKRAKKPHSVTVRLSEDERQKLETSAQDADLSLSNYVRQILVGEADELDALISDRGRNRPLPNPETIAEIARARSALNTIADGLMHASAIGSTITLRALVRQLEEINNSLTSLRRSRR